MSGTGRCLLAWGLLLGGALTSAAAEEPLKRDWVYPPRGEMRVTLEVLVDGIPVRLVPHRGQLYLPVPRLGAEYEVRVNNHGPRRVTAIVSVDGLSVLDGRPASESRSGYLVDPYGNIVIKGWRRDRETVAAFTFEERDRSYAARMGYTENIGVIGLVAFEELVPRPRPFLEKKDALGPLARSAEGKSGDTGTGWGRDIESPVYKVPFLRSTNRRAVTIYYDTAEALRRAGVPIDRPGPWPFPGDPEYAPPPPRIR